MKKATERTKDASQGAGMQAMLPILGVLATGERPRVHELAGSVQQDRRPDGRAGAGSPLAAAAAAAATDAPIPAATAGGAAAPVPAATARAAVPAGRPLYAAVVEVRLLENSVHTTPEGGTAAMAGAACHELAAERALARHRHYRG